MKKLLIFDASNYMFRAYFAAPHMNNSTGFPTGALHFYTSMILSVIRRISPDAIALALDVHGPKFRHKLYPDYKGQREAPPEELQLQFPWFHKITNALGIQAYECENYEADDIIGTLTKQARSMGWHVIIASSDKDLMQLIERTDDVDTVVMLDAMAKGASKQFVPITVDNVFERFQVSPDKVADVLALAGDTIDNIPGCKGIGEKTAGKLIAEFGSLEALIEHIDDIKKPAQHKNLLDFAPSAECSKKLTTLVCDVPVQLKLEALNPDPQKVTEVFSALDLSKLLTDILGPDARIDKNVEKAAVPAVQTTSDDDAPHDESDKTNKSIAKSDEMPAAARFTTVHPASLIRPLQSPVICKSESQLAEFIDNAPMLAIAPLWLDATFTRRQLLGFALADKSRSLYVPIKHGKTLFGYADSVENADNLLLALLQSDKPKAVYGLKPLVQYAMAHQIDVNLPAFFDAEIAAYIVHPEQSAAFDLVAQHYLAHKPEITPENWLGTGKKTVSPASFSVHDAANISTTWAQLTMQLAERLPDELERTNLTNTFKSLDLPTAKILAQMEFSGIQLDIDFLRTLSKSFDAELTRLDAEAHAFSDDNFNINSPKDLSRFLFDVLDLKPATKKNRKHGLSTDQDTLESIDHPIAQAILEYRAISKLRSTYSETLAAQADPVSHRIHGCFNECVTATTRLSSSDPNLQNIPGRTELGRQIKRSFIPKPGHSFISADYSQIELRLMAAFSKEPALCTAYHNGEDVHSRTAASLFEIPIETVTKQQRQLAKTINFGLIYGMGAQKLARETGYSKADAKAFLDKFHAQFPTLSAYFADQLEIARRQGETRTIFGHRRPLPELYDSKPQFRAFGERVVGNAPIQGSASDIVKRAMIRLDDLLRQNGLHANLLIQVHDELLLECPDDEVEKTAKILVDAMENAADIGVPLRVELKIGKNWADMTSPDNI